MPSFAALPLLMAYAGHTTIVIPKPLIPYVGLEVLDLGKLLRLETLWYCFEVSMHSFSAAIFGSQWGASESTKDRILFCLSVLLCYVIALIFLFYFHGS